LDRPTLQTKSGVVLSLGEGSMRRRKQATKRLRRKKTKIARRDAQTAVRGPTIVELQEQLDIRTRERDEALDQQAATAEVLKVISSSTGKLEPVFQTILENSITICEAKFGMFWLTEGHSFRCVALHGTSPAFTELRRREPIFHPNPTLLSPLGRIARSKQLVHVADCREEQAYIEGDPGFVALVDLAGARTILVVPILRENELVGALNIFRQEVRTFTDKQIELVQNFAAQAVIAIENARLFSELRHRTDDLSESLEQQTATSEVLKVISSTPGELDPVFNAMLENATRVCEADCGVLFRLDGDVFRAAAMVGLPAAYAEDLQNKARRVDAPTGLGRLARTRETVHITDLKAERYYGEGNPQAVAAVDLGGIRTYLGVPLLKENELIGAILLYCREVRPFTDKQIELVKNFASQAVIAIENARLLTELHQRTDDLSNSLEQQTATADVLKAISRSTFDLPTVLDTLINSAARLCHAEKANITLLRDGTFHYLADVGFSSALIEHMHSLKLGVHRGTISGRAVSERKVIHVPDILTDLEFAYPEAQKLGKFRTALGVPLMRDGTAIGAMFLSRERVEPFSQSQIELIQTFADQAVIAIENVRLFEEVQGRTRELAKSLEELRTTQDRLVQTQKLALLGQLTAGIAHEIKNPLNFVNNFSGISGELIDELQDTLKGMPLDDKARAEINELTCTLKSNFDKVVHHGRRADAIVKNMLQHSREGSGEHRVVDINGLVEESLNLAWHGARAETQGFEINLKQSFDASAGGADIFPQDIRRALLNVIANGFYAATKRRAETNGGDYEPTLAASTKNLGDRVEISIRDNGTGMAPDVKEKMFNPFFTTKPTGEGTGLGLSISHDIIVKQHSGSIEVDTQPGEFTEIRVILPRVAVFV
jgi:two-component system NtrC family sensor kinase